VLQNPVFKEGKFDTSFIAQHEATLLKPRKDLSSERQATIAMTKVWLESLKFRTTRASSIDPWSQRDCFRVNH
jgi:acetyl/propionyl-CoA carboxylase alpha subunit